MMSYLLGINENTGRKSKVMIDSAGANLYAIILGVLVNLSCLIK